MVFFFCLGMSLMIVAPQLKRWKRASPALAMGALIVLAIMAFGLLYVDPRNGLAANESNRKQYLFFLAIELPVFLLAVISWKGIKWAFWVGWGINLALSIFVAWVFIQFTFFWHW